MTKLLFPGDAYLFDCHTDIQNTFIEKMHAQGTEETLWWFKDVKKRDQKQTRPYALRYECI